MSFHTLVVCPDAHERHTVLYRIAGAGAAWVDVDDANPLGGAWCPGPAEHVVVNELACARGGFAFATHTLRLVDHPVWTFGCASALCVHEQVSHAADCVFLAPSLTPAEARYVFRRANSAREFEHMDRHAAARAWCVYTPSADSLTIHTEEP